MFPYRFIVAGMGFMIYFNMFQIRMNLYLAMIAMQNTTHFNMTDNQQATLMSGYFYGQG